MTSTSKTASLSKALESSLDAYPSAASPAVIKVALEDISKF